MTAITWDEERAVELARQALWYMERTYPPGASLADLSAYHDRVLAAEETGDFEAFTNALRRMMRAGRAQAGEAKSSAAHVLTYSTKESEDSLSMKTRKGDS